MAWEFHFLRKNFSYNEVIFVGGVRYVNNSGCNSNFSNYILWYMPVNIYIGRDIFHMYINDNIAEII